MEEKRYCIYCGKEIDANAEICPHCHKKVTDKENLFVDYLIQHTKDKFKGDAEDKVYEAVKNYLLSHLYGAVVTVTLITTVVTGVRATASREKVNTVDDRPSAVAGISTASDLASLTTEVTPLYPELTYDFTSQVAVMVANYNQWASLTDYDMYVYYYITDLDQDGLLEINAAETMGTGIFTYHKAYEVNESLNGLNEMNTDYFTDGGSFENFILLNSDPYDENIPKKGYYDPDTKTYYYFVSDVWRGGISSNGIVDYALYVKDNVYHADVLGTYEYAYHLDGTERFTYTADGQEYESEDAYNAAIEAKYEGLVPFTFSVPRIDRSDITNLHAQLFDLASQYYLHFENGKTQNPVAVEKPAENTSLESILNNKTILNGSTFPAYVNNDEKWNSGLEDANGILSTLRQNINGQQYILQFTLENQQIILSMYQESEDGLQLVQSGSILDNNFTTDAYKISVFEKNGQMFIDVNGNIGYLATGMTNKLYQVDLSPEAVTSTKYIDYSGSWFEEDEQNSIKEEYSWYGIQCNDVYTPIIDQNEDVTILFQIQRFHNPGFRFTGHGTEEFGYTTFTDYFTDHRSVN